MKKINKISKFASREEEDTYWKKTDSTDMVDWSKATSPSFTNLKPTVKSVSIRLPQSMIDELKVLANKSDIPYQSLMKIYLNDRIKKEFGSLAS